MTRSKGLAAVIAAAMMTAVAAPAVHAQDAAATAAPPPAIDPAVAKAQAKARAKQVAEWKRQYGPGPYPDEIDAFLSKREDKLREYYRVLYYDGEHNAVLNFERLGLFAMETGYYADAEKAFDGALDRIEAFYGKDKQAQKATDMTRMEVNKDFKGEPYERAMAYYYRGLLYLRKGDYDNARASFKAAEYQDTVSADETYQSDFGLLTFLQGWASQCAGDKSQADEAFANAAKIDASLQPPGPSDNVLVLAELGMGPVKALDGQYQEKMIIRQSANVPENAALVTMGEGKGIRTWKLVPAANIYTQASTRGGRAIDGILNGKAQFKSGLETTSAITSSMSSSLLSNNSTGNAGLYMAGASALLGMFASTVRPAADIRMWDSLPANIMLGTTEVSAPKSGAALALPAVSLAYRQDDAALDLSGTAPMTGAVGKCGIAWSRSRSVTGLPAGAPGDNAKIAANRKFDKAAWAKDEAFRATLR